MSNELNMEAECAAFEAWANAAAIRTDLGAWDAWLAARRAAPVSAPMGTNGEAIPLPPLPQHIEVGGEGWGLEDFQSWKTFTVENMEKYARQAIAPYAERIRHLERELEQAKAAFIGSENARKDAEKQAKLQEIADLGQEIERGPVQSIDTPEFRELISAMLNEYWESEGHIQRLIAYIDGRTAGTASDELIEIGSRMATTLEVLATALKNPGTAEGVRRTVEEWRAAAPAPLNGMEEAK